MLLKKRGIDAKRLMENIAAIKQAFPLTSNLCIFLADKLRWRGGLMSYSLCMAQSSFEMDKTVDVIQGICP